MMSGKSCCLKMLNAASVLMLVLSAGCGYVLEGGNPPLPEDARSIGVAPIQNRTFEPELETQLIEQLKVRLRANSSVTLLRHGQADLSLNIILLELKTINTGLDAIQNTKGVKYALSGRVRLIKRKTGQLLWEEKSMQVEFADSASGFSPSLSEVLVARNLRELTRLYAEKIYERLFVRF